MAAVTIFRGLVLAAFAVLVAGVASGVLAYFQPALPVEVDAYLKSQNVGTMANVFSEANWGTQVAVGIAFVVVARREEAFLAEKFGSAFAAYRARVPRMLPRLSLYRDAATITVAPRTLYTTFFDSLVFFSAMPGRA